MSVSTYPEIDYLQSIKSQTNNARSLIYTYNSRANSLFNEFDSKVYDYETTSEKGRVYVSEMDGYIMRLHDTKRDLIDYKDDLKEAESEISNIQKEFQVIEELDAETLVNPIVVRNKQVYVPDLDPELLALLENRSKDMTPIEKVVRGISLINLQTIFPVLLLLITIFLSLLVSSFICLNEINSSANCRVRLVKGVFLHEFISVYFSSLLIVAVPIFCILFLGNHLFALHIFHNFSYIALLLFFISSIFTMFGIGLSYLIKKESITLLMSTFFLVFLMFFSGFLLPIERMTESASSLANIFPGKVALNAFNKMIFYDIQYSIMSHDFVILMIWFALLAIFTLVIKKLRNV